MLKLVQMIGNAFIEPIRTSKKEALVSMFENEYRKDYLQMKRALGREPTIREVKSYLRNS
jgi:formaldehyde-activating enzyme involved in methanogenesis